ncbi:DUF3397 domain-containing protein [Psychrobacillus sp. NPDC058041]|uniref:DUF3397 domain-containing protein n=1 Tax=Psychrobacillus sp. NPDC058041 TaxID=3346310 RepID=UPI0036DC32AA
MITITKIFSFIILFPVILFILTFIISKYILSKRKKSFGVAADVTTFLLFFSVSNAFSIVFSKSIFLLMIIISLLIATIFTYLDWRNQKEIEVMPLLRKIWRLLFILLCVTYALILFIGVFQYVLKYVS